MPGGVQEHLPSLARLVGRDGGAEVPAPLFAGVEVVDLEIEVNCLLPFSFGQPGGA